MLTTRVIPCLLLKDRGLVKTLKFKNPRYVGDPINAVKIFNDKEVDELVFLDITATVEKRRPNFRLISDIASESFMPFGYGGGIRNVDDVKELFNLGVEKVIINSYAAENSFFIREVSELFGSQSIVISIDAKRNNLDRYKVYTRGGTSNTGLDPVEFAKSMQEMGAGEILLNSIDRDGMMQGYDIQLIQRVSIAVSIPVIACGGAGTLSHMLEAVRLGGASAAAAGSMFVFHGKNRAVLITYPRQQELQDLFSKYQ